VRLPLLNFAPQAFEVVELPLFGREHVDDCVAQVQKNPAAVGVALYALDRMPLGLGALDDRIDDGARLNLRTAGDEYERIGQNRATGYVDGNKIFALFLERGVANDVD
jgi:hypothetical protein